MKISNIKLNPRNPRNISDLALKKLSESIKRDPQFMVLRPIIIDNDMMIIGGNQRYKAIKLLGKTKIPDNWVVKADNLTKAQKKRLILIDNAPEGMEGCWDYDILQSDWDIGELEDLGFILNRELKEFDDKNENIFDEPEIEFSQELLLEHNYIVFYYDNPFDWEVAKEKYGLKKVKDLIPRKGQPTGIGRVVKGKDYL